ncbi:MAG TPA: GNAT family N-acetyltransferase [Dehalococcoidia bacterium]|nr:GNAT family N-acetyltransferase [Dehalococcoidia bacterium]
MAFVIREASVDDAEAVARVDIDSHVAAYRQIFGETYLDGASPERMLRRWRLLLTQDPSVAYGKEHWFVAAADGGVIGYIGVGPSRDDDAMGLGEVRAIYVHPDAWRQGAGGALLDAGLAALSSDGFEEAMLWVLEDNAQGRAFYEKQGWSLDEARRTQHREEASFGELRYRRRL